MKTLAKHFGLAVGP